MADVQENPSQTASDASAAGSGTSVALQTVYVELEALEAKVDNLSESLLAEPSAEATVAEDSAAMLGYLNLQVLVLTVFLVLSVGVNVGNFVMGQFRDR